MRFLLAFLILFMTIAVNLPDSVIARLGFEPNYLLAAMVAVVLAGLVQHRHLLSILLVVALSWGANLPADLAEHWSMDPDIFLAGLIAVVLTPMVAKTFE